MAHAQSSDVFSSKSENNFNEDELSSEILSSADLHNEESSIILSVSSDDWCNATEELLNTLPHPWTRGLLYFLMIFVAIILPWAMLCKVDETGNARGRLEPKGEVFKVDAAVSGTVTKVLVNEGQLVNVKQPLVELESESVHLDLQQSQAELEGQQNRLGQLQLGKTQLMIAITTQQQQNKAQELEKIAQVVQAQQDIDAKKATYDLQKEEKLAQADQAKQSFAYSKSAYNFAYIRFLNEQNKSQRYMSLFKEGAISKERLNEIEQSVEENQQFVEQARSDVALATYRLKEQYGSHQRTMSQAQAEIKLAESRLNEQQSSYQSTLQAGKLALFKSEEQLNELETQIASLKTEILRTQSQIQSLKLQLAQRILRAPVSGTIFQLAIQRPGTVVQPSQLIAEIAPQGESLVLRAQIATQESGYLNEEMPVKIKFDAYPFQDYGIVEGRLTRISKNSKVTETAFGTSATYDLEIEVLKPCIQTANECIPLTAGQTATAEVVIRQRQIIDFILDPFKKLQKGGLKL